MHESKYNAPADVELLYRAFAARDLSLNPLLQTII